MLDHLNVVQGSSCNANIILLLHLLLPQHTVEGVSASVLLHINSDKFKSNKVPAQLMFFLRDLAKF